MSCCDILVEIRRKVKENLFNKDKLYLSDECNNHNSEYVDNNTMSNRFENEVLTMNYGILKENWFDVSNPQIINEKSVDGIKHTNFLDEEFLLLEVESDDKYDDFEFERVFISSSNTSDVTVSNSFTSAWCEVPVMVGNSGMDVMMHQQHNDSVTTSIASSPRTMSCNMAETLVQNPPCSDSSSQAASSMEKSEVKTEPLQYPYSHFGNSHDIIASEKSEEASGTRNDISCLTRKSRDTPLVDTSDANSLTNGNVLGEPLKLSSNIKKKYSTKPIIHSEEEEIAFLRSLGWEKNCEDASDEGLTLEEILDFYDKHAKNCSFDKIFSKLCIKT